MTFALLGAACACIAVALPSILSARPLALLPFLFNRHYFAEHYAGLATVWLAAAVAPPLLELMPRERGRWLAAAVVVILWVPRDALWDVVSPGAPGHQVARWYEEVHAALGAGWRRG